jgi:hypothetical protein
LYNDATDIFVMQLFAYKVIGEDPRRIVDNALVKCGRV